MPPQRFGSADASPPGLGSDGAPRLALAEIASQYLADLATRARPKSVEEATRGLARIVRDLDVESAREVTPPAILRWRAARVAGGASNKTANTEVGYLRAALGLAVSLGQLPVHPLAGLRGLPVGGRHQRRRPRALSDWELRRVFAAADDLDGTAIGGRSALVRALALTGARWGELTSATWGDLDLERGTLTLRAETTKTERARTLPVAPELALVLAELPPVYATRIGRAPRPAEPIFLSPTGKPWARGHANFYRWLRTVFEAAGVDHKDGTGRVVHVHALRHTFATRCARAGVPIATAQRLTGHATPAMLLSVYAHVGDEESRRAIEALPPLGAVGRIEAASGGEPSTAPPSGDNAVRGGRWLPG